MGTCPRTARAAFSVMKLTLLAPQLCISTDSTNDAPHWGPLGVSTCHLQGYRPVKWHARKERNERNETASSPASCDFRGGILQDRSTQKESCVRWIGNTPLVLRCLGHQKVVCVSFSRPSSTWIG